MRVIRIACRDEASCLARAGSLMQAIRAYDPTFLPELVPVAAGTPADSPETPEGVRAPWMDAIESRLRDGEVDLALHQLREFPYETDPALPIVAAGPRPLARVALVIAKNRSEPDFKKPLGIANLCHFYQLARLFPGWGAAGVVRDIFPRLEALDDGVYGGLALSRAALDFLRQPPRIFNVYSVAQLTPQAVQDLTVVQGRAGKSASYLIGYHSIDAWDMALAERAFARAMNRLGEASFLACAAVKEKKVTVRGVMLAKSGQLYEGELTGRRADVETLGAALASRLHVDAYPRPRRAPRT